MSRSQVSLRAAVVEDALFLAQVWNDSMRRGEIQDQIADVELIVKAAADSAEQRIVIAEYDGQPAGAVFLRVTTISPINLEPMVQAISPHVAAPFRRHGVGRTLMEAAVAYAEELGIAHVMTAATSNSRDANRFMARLGFGAQLMVRVAPTHLVRAKIEAQRPASQRIAGGRQRGQLMAVRRSMRRMQVDETDAD